MKWYFIVFCIHLAYIHCCIMLQQNVDSEASTSSSVEGSCQLSKYLCEEIEDHSIVTPDTDCFWINRETVINAKLSLIAEDLHVAPTSQAIVRKNAVLSLWHATAGRRNRMKKISKKTCINKTEQQSVGKHRLQCLWVSNVLD